MGNIKDYFNNYYWNSNLRHRNFVLWEIFKDVRRHTTDFVGKERAYRFKQIFEFGMLNRQVMDFFVLQENPKWHFFRSIVSLRFDKGLDVNKDFYKLMYGWDFVSDFDNEYYKEWYDMAGEHVVYESCWKHIKIGLKKPYEACKKLKNFYDNNKIPYILNFTQSSFRLLIPWESMKDYFGVGDYGRMNKLMFKIIKEKVYDNKVPSCLDVAKIGSGRELTRVLYSLGPDSGLVSYPLTDEEFDNFDLSLVKPEAVLCLCDKENPSRMARNHLRKGDFKAFYDLIKEDKGFDKVESENIKYNRTKEDIKSLYEGLPDVEKQDLLSQIRQK